MQFELFHNLSPWLIGFAVVAAIGAMLLVATLGVMLAVAVRRERPVRKARGMGVGPYYAHLVLGH